MGYEIYIKEEPFAVICYCIDEELCTIGEFIELEYSVLKKANNKDYKLFYSHICLN